MQSRLLRYFLTTFNQLNITSAADALGITQPALTKSIQALEADLGVKLFDRLPNGVLPTSYGEVLAKHVTTILLEYDHAIFEIETMKVGASGKIRIGAGPVWLIHLLPQVIEEFRRTHANVQILLEGMVINQALPALLRGEIDIFCGSLDFPEQPDLIKRRVREVEHVIFASRGHPLHAQPRFKPTELLQYPWAMLTSDDVGRRQLAAFFARSGLKAPSAAFESSSIVSILEVLRQGSFLACLARPMLEINRFGTLVELPGPGVIWRYEAGIAVRDRRHVPAITTRFMNLVAERFGEAGDENQA